jgi:hypothetical protein
MDKSVPKSSNKVHNGMKNSLPSTAQVEADLALTAFVNQELRSLVAAGLTSPEHDLEECGHIVAKRSRVTKPSKGGNGRSRPTPSFPSVMSSAAELEDKPTEGKAPLWKDPFGASDVPAGVDPVTLARTGYARTKQCARKFTGVHPTKSCPPTPNPRYSSGSGSSGNSSDHSRARLWRKGNEQDAHKAAIKAAKAAKPKQAEDGWVTDSGDSGSEGRSNPPAKVAKPTIVPRNGRFNGRVHPTPDDGSCGIASLRGAMQHLARTRGYDYDIPETDVELRLALVDYIRNNMDALAEGEIQSLRQSIAGEFFPEDPDAKGRRSIWCPDVNATAWRRVEEDLNWGPLHF